MWSFSMKWLKLLSLPNPSVICFNEKVCLKNLVRTEIPIIDSYVM